MLTIPIPLSPETTEANNVLTAAEEITAAARLIMAPGEVHEARIPKAGRRGTISGYFDNPGSLANAVLAYDGDVPGIYITLNPVNPALLARAANRLKERAELSAADHDITRRRWLLIYCDPVKPAGVSSTDREHGRAITVATCGVWDYLRQFAFGDPIVADSGNGCHLLYRLDVQNDLRATATVKRILADVAEACGTDDVSVDTGVYNAGRITKLYGTLTRKGDDLPERPHRRSHILEAPERMEVLTWGQ